MPVFRIIPTGDLRLSGDTGNAMTTSGGSYVIIQGIEQIRQRLSIRLQFFAGEWFLDLRQGIPMYRDVLVKNPNAPLIRSLYRRVILNTPGVLSLPELNLVIDSKTRRATVTFKAICTDGVIVVKPGDEDFLVPQLLAA